LPTPKRAKAWGEFSALANASGDAIARVPSGSPLIPILPKIVAGYCGFQRWMDFVFHATEQPRNVYDPVTIAFQEIAADGSKKPVPPVRYGGGLFPYSAFWFERFASEESAPPHWRAWAKELPDYWLSECRDVFLASADAITLLLQSPAPASDPDKIGCGAAPRDAWFLQRYEADGTDTYHKPAKIHAKWKAMKTTERAEICPASPNTITKGAVEKAIKRALVKRDGPKAAKPRKIPRKKT